MYYEHMFPQVHIFAEEGDKGSGPTDPVDIQGCAIPINALRGPYVATKKWDNYEMFMMDKLDPKAYHQHVQKDLAKELAKLIIDSGAITIDYSRRSYDIHIGIIDLDKIKGYTNLN